MKELLDEAMHDGAIGLSTMLAMPPGSLATTDDLVDLCKVVARHGGIYSTHNRNEGTGVFEAIREAIAIGERAGVPVDIIHVKIADQQYWGRMNEVIALIEAARSRGVNVQTNIYPYTRGNNNLASIIPPWAHEGGNEAMLARLKDSGQRQRMKKDIQERHCPAGTTTTRPSAATGAGCSISGKGQFEGLTMDRVIVAARPRGKDPTPEPLDVLFDLLIEEGGSVPTVYAHHTEEDMNLALAQPWCSIGSDGSAYADRRSAAARQSAPAELRHVPARAGRVCPRDGSAAAGRRGAQDDLAQRRQARPDRSRPACGRATIADLTLFDPAQVIDRATYEQPFAYNDGIEYVIVNGQLVLAGDIHRGAKPGKALRRGR